MPREAPIQTATSFEAFLEFETRSRERHELVNGDLFVMTHETDRHDHVGGGLRARLFLEAQKGNFRLHGCDLLVSTPEDVGYYPDVFVVLDPSNDTPRVKRRPHIIIEVLSESTEAIDRGEKLHNYRTIPSLEQYVLLSQNEPLADVYSRQVDGTWRHDILERGTSLHFSSIDFSIDLDALYENLPPLETM
jgi:Uma2 family endonuclease